MAVTVASFRAAYPEFASTTDPLIERYIGEAGLWVSECWGDQQDTGTMYYIAHMSQVEADRVAAGIDASGRGTTSIGSGSHKVTIGNTNSMSSDAGSLWQRTRYGRMFWALLQRFKGGRIYAV